MAKRMGKLLIGLIIVGLVIVTIMLLHMLYVLDFSQQKPYTLSQEQKKNDLYLISYARGPEVFLKNRNMLVASAINRGFDVIINYRREHIAPEYIAKNPVLNEKFGAGFWLWKPYLIQKTLQNMPEGAILMYSDSGMMLRQSPREFLEQGLSIPGKDILLFNYEPHISGFDGKAVSGDAFAAIGCSEDRCRYAPHVWAGFIVLRNSNNSRAFIAEWLKYCENADLLTGKESGRHPNFPEFSHHQHDEALLSVLANRDAHKVNFIRMDKGFYKRFTVHRRKTDEKSVLGYISTDYIHMQRKLPNWPVRFKRIYDLVNTKSY